MTGDLTLDTFQIDNPIPLPPCRGWPKKAVHDFDRAQAVALLAALEINRPLLVRGEPGCGKTQMARAAAQVLRMPLASLVVNERTQTEDLLYHYDALKRLSDANIQGKDISDEKKYLSAGPLWWALSHSTAGEFEGTHSCKPDLEEDSEFPRDFENGVVLLIDEIDKADRSVPNSLLEPLGNFSFNIPYLGRRIEWSTDDTPPLIIITSNAEQQLPAAFVRRCLVLDLSLPSEEDREEFIAALSTRGNALFGEKFQETYPSNAGEESVFAKVAATLLEKRKQALSGMAPFKPGQAEYFDHLEAMLAMKKIDPNLNEERAIEELAKLTFVKSAR